jgi:hypothetical protein
MAGGNYRIRFVVRETSRQDRVEVHVGDAAVEPAQLAVVMALDVGGLGQQPPGGDHVSLHRPARG